MKKFLWKILIFALPILIFSAGILLLPPTKSARNSLLFASVRKDALLKSTPQPRIIFAGWSETPFGQDSGLIKEALKVNPIDMGLHGGLRQTFVFNKLLPDIKSGDVVVLTVTYQMFYVKNVNDVSVELFRMMADVDWRNARYLNWRQLVRCLDWLPYYIVSKCNPLNWRIRGSPFYRRDAFNEFGDAVAHWGQPRPLPDFSPGRFPAGLSADVVETWKHFRDAVEARGAVLYVAWPGFPISDFEKHREKIIGIERALKDAGFKTLGTPERYALPDDLIFDFWSHLTKEGAQRRTRLLMEDLRAAKIPSLILKQ
jgi:hypothetical protein